MTFFAFRVNSLLLLLLLLATFNCLEVSATTSKNVYQVYRLVNACPQQGVVMELQNISIKLDNNIFYVRFDVEVQEEVAEDLKVEFTLTRCLNRADPNTCENYPTLTFPYFCKFMKISGPWSLYLDSMIPPFRCPVQKGSYKMTKSIACDMKQIERLKVARGYVFIINVKHYGMTTNKLLFCAKCEGHT